MTQSTGCSPDSSSHHVFIPTRSKKERGYQEDHRLPRNFTTDFFLNVIIQNSEVPSTERWLGMEIKLMDNTCMLSLNYTLYFKAYLKSHLLHKNFFTCCCSHTSIIPIDFHFINSRSVSHAINISCPNSFYLMFCFLKMYTQGKAMLWSSFLSTWHRDHARHILVLYMV